MYKDTLSISNDVYDVGHIRTAFCMFMREINPKLNPRTLKTYCSDALFIWAQLPERWVRQIVEGGEHSDEIWKSKLKSYIRKDITAARTCPDKDARSYTKHFWQLILFLRMLRQIEEGRLGMPRRIGE